MKAELGRIVAEAPVRHGFDVCREYLQVRALQHLSFAGQMNMIAFMGGTALRIIYGVSRYSEDLDFALERRPDEYSFSSVLAAIQAGFEREAYRVEIADKSGRTAVDKAFVRFPGLLNELGLSPHASQVLSIKIEIDTNPPAGAGIEVSSVTRFVPVRIMHHDRASLLAGKIAAVLAREYTKSRDLYDLMWYLGNTTWPAPNIALLRNALSQNGWAAGALPDEQNWRGLVLERLSSVSWRDARLDILQFLERPEEAELLEFDTFERLLTPR